MNRRTIDFTTGSIAKPLVAFSIPLFFGNILQQLYSITDAIIVGNLLGPDALAAIGATSPVTNLSIALAIGITLGVSVTVSQFFGAHEPDKVRLTISTGYIFFFVFGRAMRDLLWQYYFFVEGEGAIHSAAGRAMLEQLDGLCDRLRVLGTYRSHSELKDR